MMCAKLIIYQHEPVVGSDWQSGLENAVQSFTPPTFNNTRWELTANNLTTGNVAELLFWLDELGFSDE